MLLLGAIFTGMVTWFIGRPSYHIGASGIIYFLASFIFFKGIFTKYYRLVAVSLLVVFLYGSMLWYIFPIEEKISWEGHLSGLVVGLTFSLLYNIRVTKKAIFDWEKDSFNAQEDPFVKYFDAQGNFVGESEDDINNYEDTEKVHYNYIYKPSKRNN